MASASFDTLSFARALEAAGVEPRHAEAHAEAVLAAIRESREALATRTDLYRTALVQGAAIVALVVALVKLL